MPRDIRALIVGQNIPGIMSNEEVVCPPHRHPVYMEHTHSVLYARDCIDWLCRSSQLCGVNNYRCTGV